MVYIDPLVMYRQSRYAKCIASGASAVNALNRETASLIVTRSVDNFPSEEIRERSFRALPVKEKDVNDRYERNVKGLNAV